MVDRFRHSGRENLVVIVVSDFDPKGEDIPSSFGISLRDDFDLDEDEIRIVKAALTYEQVQTLDLHEGLPSKESSSRHNKFVKKYGDRVWELEALPSAQLRGILDEAILSVLDMDAFNAEVAQGEREVEELEEKREKLRLLLMDEI